MTSHNREIEKFYDRIARYYSRTIHEDSLGTNSNTRLLAEFSKRASHLHPIWDLGCGPGDACLYLQQQGLPVAGVDISSQLVTLARKRFPGIAFLQGNILNLPFPDQSIGAFIALYAMVHFQESDLCRALNEFHRTLKPEGLLLVTYYIGQENLKVKEFLGHKIELEFVTYKRGYIDRILGECGFKDIFRLERETAASSGSTSKRAHVFARKSR